MGLPELISIISIVAGLGGPLFTYLILRRKVPSEVALTDAGAYDKLSATVERQDGRMELQRDEIDELRTRLRTMEKDNIVRDQEMAERDRVIASQGVRISALEDEVTTLTKYLRRVIAQLRKAGIAPDLPPAVLEQLFKGT